MEGAPIGSSDGATRYGVAARPPLGSWGGGEGVWERARYLLRKYISTLGSVLDRYAQCASQQEEAIEEYQIGLQRGLDAGAAQSIGGMNAIVSRGRTQGACMDRMQGIGRFRWDAVGDAGWSSEKSVAVVVVVVVVEGEREVEMPIRGAVRMLRCSTKGGG